MWNINDGDVITTSRKYKIRPGTLKCGEFALFDGLYPLRIIRYRLKRRWGKNVTDTIRRYYHEWKLQLGNGVFDLQS